MKKQLLILIISFVLLHSCGVLFNRNITCKPHIFKAEFFWFQGNKMDSYILINKVTGVEKVFVLNDKWLSHRDNYLTDTGCDCHDKSSQLLIADNDSIWAMADYRYLKNNETQFRDAFTFKLGSVKWIFNNETSTITKGTKIIEGVEIPTKTYEEIFNNKNYKLVVGRGIGVLSLHLDGEIWKRKEPKIIPITKNSYRFMKSYCD